MLFNNFRLPGRTGQTEPFVCLYVHTGVSYARDSLKSVVSFEREIKAPEPRDLDGLLMPWLYVREGDTNNFLMLGIYLLGQSVVLATR